MEEDFSLQQILLSTCGRLINLREDTHISISPQKICTDTRNLKKGDLFVALKGKNFDGHNFLKEACDKGALGAVVEKLLPIPSPHFFLIQVEDTLKALQKLAKFHRKRLSFPFIGITGSNGKTTVKELISQILSRKYHVGKSFGNFNNEIGVPLSLLKISSSHQVGVLEMGMSSSGEIATLSRIVQPNIGLITNIHSSHIGFLGTIKEIAQAKGEIIPILNRNRENYLVLNEDDDWTESFKRKAKCRVVTFGLSKNSNFKAENVSTKGEKVSFVLEFPNKEHLYLHLPLPKFFNIYNLLAACSVSSLLGVSSSDIKDALFKFKPLPLHFQLNDFGQYRLINDSYNANPESMQEALRLLRGMDGKRKIAVLGDMLELGKKAQFFHYQIGKIAAKLGLNAMFAYGEFSEDMVRGAKEEGIKDAFFFTDKRFLVNKLLDYKRSGDCFLIKGSRGMKMEEIADSLRISLCSPT